MAKLLEKIELHREYLETGTSVILRLPALFMLEAWYRSDLNSALEKGTTQDVKFIITAAYYSILLLVVVLATIPLEKLVMLYMYFVSLSLISGAYYLSDLYVKSEETSEADIGHSLFSALRDYEVTKKMVVHICAQCAIAAIISYLTDMTDWTKYSLLVFTLPMIARLSSLPARDLQAVHNFSTMFTILMILFYTFNNLGNGLHFLQGCFSQFSEAVTEVGWIPVIITYWHAVMLPIQLLIFWIFLFISRLYVFFETQSASVDGTLLILLAAMGECCASPISLFALCITISYVSYYILTLTKVFLLGREGLVHDNDLLRGWTEGFTMLLIALQTGLLDLKPLQRAFLMSILLFIVVSSLIQSMYEITDPILLGLSASHSRSLNKHLRAVALCTVLWTLPLYMTFIICQYFELDFWLMIIVSSCVLTSVQVIGSLLVYWLFLYDTFRTEPWEKMDDVVYYIRSSVRVLEFIVAVSVVFFGIKESVLSEWSILNSVILLIHSYFNIWQRLQSGWKTFLLRREAVKKIESLPEATSQQLTEHNDVCSICFQEMKAARITKCGHYFHGCCLRKWLYVKETCPLCHREINENSTTGNAEELDINEILDENDGFLTESDSHDFEEEETDSISEGSVNF